MTSLTSLLVLGWWSMQIDHFLLSLQLCRSSTDAAGSPIDPTPWKSLYLIIFTSEGWSHVTVRDDLHVTVPMQTKKRRVVTPGTPTGTVEARSADCRGHRKKRTRRYPTFRKNTDVNKSDRYRYWKCLGCHWLWQEWAMPWTRPFL